MKVFRQYQIEPENFPEDFVVAMRMLPVSGVHGFRFGIRKEGAFFKEPENGSFHQPFQGKPVRQLPGKAMDIWAEMAAEAKPQNLPEMVWDEDYETFSHPFVEIWYFRLPNGEVKNIVVENGKKIPELNFFKNLVDRLLAHSG